LTAARTRCTYTYWFGN